MIGKHLLHYEITGKLGEGGMGEVYQALDSRLNRDVAIKVLPELFVNDPERLARFEREAQLLAALNHPNIGSIYGLEQDGDNRFLVLELIDGDTLQELVRKGVPLEDALDMSAQVAKALEAAHEQGIVHRDLKPANVKVTPDGVVKVLDFGLAKAWAPDASDPALSASPTLTAQMTQAGMILGTAAYMSPEQARGQEVDKRADIWSFGVLTYELLTGHGLFAGDTVTDTLAAVVRAEPDWDELPRSTPRRTRELLVRCLAKNPDVRLRDIGEARIALEEAEPEPLVEQAPAEASPGLGRMGLLGWVVAAAAAVAAALAWSGATGSGDQEPPRVVSVQAEIATGLDLDDAGPDYGFSPSGESIVFGAVQDGERALHLRHLADLESRKLVGSTNNEYPSFSPDGEWVAYFSEGSLRKVSVRGGAPLTLDESAPSGRGLWWGDDGFIYYAPMTTTGIWRVSEQGGEPEQLTVPVTGDERSHRFPQLLPGGERVLMTVQPTSRDFDEANLEVLEIATGERTVLHRGGTMGRFLPTGHLLFMRQGTLHAAPFDTAGLQLTSAPAPVRTGVAYGRGYGGADAIVSPDGTLLFMPGGASGDTPVALLRVQADGSSEPLSAREHRWRAPSISSDGRFMLFSTAAGMAADIWMLDLERDVDRRLTFSEASDFRALWAPDDSYFVFTSERTGALAIWRGTVDGSEEPVQLTEAANFQVPDSFSPDGRYLLFRWIQGATRGDLMLLDLETGVAEPYLATEFNEGESTFSPDGRWVAYRSDEAGEPQIFVRPFPLRPGKWRVSTGIGLEPKWSPDGKTLYYRGDNRSFNAVSVTETAGGLEIGTPELLFADTFVTGNGIQYDLLPDGSFVFLRSEENTGERVLPVMVFNWFEELNRLVPIE